MFLFGWLRRRRLREKDNTSPARSVREDGIVARVDMIRLEALAEAAYDSMYETRSVGVKHRFDEAREYFDGAIDAANRAHLPQEAARLTRRREQVVRIFNSQFRYSSGN